MIFFYKSLTAGEGIDINSFPRKTFSFCLGGDRRLGKREVVKEIPFPMWSRSSVVGLAGSAVIYRADYHHWQGGGWGELEGVG